MSALAASSSYSDRNIYYEDEGEGEQSLSNNNDIQEYNNTSAERRRSDDYDSMFFTPTTPKPSGSSLPTGTNDSYYYESNNNRQGELTDNIIDQTDVGEQKTNARPRAASSSSYNNNNQRKTQNPQEEVPPAILSTRALYQFSPLRPGSRRGMPPTVSDYDDSYEYDIAGEDSSSSSDGYGITMSVDDDEEDLNGASSSRVYADNSGDKEEDGNFFDDDVKVQPVKSTPKLVSKNKIQAQQSTDSDAVDSILPKVSSSSDTTKDIASSPLTDKSTSPNKSLSLMSTPSFSRVKARAVVTPSFMEPQKTKSMINLNNEYNTDERSIPTGASNGNGSMSHLTTLSHQLDHLTTQIYQLNNGVEFNVNSPKQVANVLFGEDNTGDSSTNKDVLEAMASAGNEMA